MSYELVSEQVLPLKKDSIEKAEQYANEVIENYLKEMEKAEWDLNAFVNKSEKYKLFYALSTWVKPSRSPSEPNLRKISQEAEKRFIDAAKENAGMQYDKFIFKLTKKVGSIISAKLTGDHVWGYSILTTTDLEGNKFYWKTQQIINVSKLGKVFNQYPTRKVKGI